MLRWPTTPCCWKRSRELCPIEAGPSSPTRDVESGQAGTSVERVGEVRIVERILSLTLGSILLAVHHMCMNVARKAAQQLSLPAVMVAIGLLIWLDMIGQTQAMVLFILLIAVLAFNLGRKSAVLWPPSSGEE